MAGIQDSESTGHGRKISSPSDAWKSSGTCRGSILQVPRSRGCKFHDSRLLLILTRRLELEWQTAGNDHEIDASLHSDAYTASGLARRNTLQVLRSCACRPGDSSQMRILTRRLGRKSALQDLEAGISLCSDPLSPPKWLREAFCKFRKAVHADLVTATWC